MAGEPGSLKVRVGTKELALAALEVAHKDYIRTLNEISRVLLAELTASARQQYCAEEVEVLDSRIMATAFEEHAKVVDRYLRALALLVEWCPDVDDEIIARAIEEPLGWVEDLQQWGVDDKASNYLELAKRSGWAACQLLCQRWFQSGRQEDLAKATVMLRSCHDLLGKEHQGLQALIARVSERLLAVQASSEVAERTRQLFEDKRRLQGARGVDPAGRMSLGIETRVRHAVDHEASLRGGRRIDPAARMCLQLLGQRRIR